MSYDELASLPIKEISEDDCLLFLWCTIPMLPQGFKLIEDWGFEYRTSLTWYKNNAFGLGFWFRGMVEMLLMGKKGKWKAFKSQIPNLISAPITKHSRKPDRFRIIIEGVTRNALPRIELFARTPIHGWDTWGNDPMLTESQPLERFN